MEIESMKRNFRTWWLTAAGLSVINNLIQLVKNDRLTITSDEKRELLSNIKNVTNYIKLKYHINCYHIKIIL